MLPTGAHYLMVSQGVVLGVVDGMLRCTYHCIIRCEVIHVFLVCVWENSELVKRKLEGWM